MGYVLEVLLIFGIVGREWYSSRDFLLCGLRLRNKKSRLAGFGYEFECETKGFTLKFIP
jgi:hypothetical protein